MFPEFPVPELQAKKENKISLHLLNYSLIAMIELLIGNYVEIHSPGFLSPISISDS